MQKLLINLLIFSFAFAWIAARNHHKISFRLSAQIALGGVAMLGLTALLGTLIAHQSLSTTFLELNNGNDMHMGVIYGIGFLYISALCFLWALSSHLKRRGPSRGRQHDTRSEP